MVSHNRIRFSGVFFSTLRRPPSSPLFPYTTLFRSACALGIAQGVEARRCISCVRVVPPHGSILHPSHARSEEHTSELQSHVNLVCRLLLEKKKSRSWPNATISG